MSTTKFLVAMLLLALLTFFSPTSTAQVFDYADIGLTVKVESDKFEQGAAGEILITIEAPWGFSITDLEGVFGITPMGEVDGISFGELDKPDPDKVDAVGGHFQDVTNFKLPFTVAADTEPGERKFNIGFKMQACDEESGMCFMPTNPEDYQREVSFEVVTGDGSAATSSSQGDSGSLEDIFASAMQGGNLWLSFLVVFLAGIISSLTPCVYPMIPITVAYVTGKSEGKTRNGFFVSLVLVLGIVITYSILGVIAGATGGTFGSYLSHPIVQGVVFAILVAMGLSMLGVWEMALPASVTNKAHTQKKGYLGALFIGLTLGIVAAPCVGPILVAVLLFIAQTQDILLGFLLMFTYAVGMGLLFIVVGTFSNAILPKSGAWMEWLKKIFAFVFFLMGVYFAQNLINMIHPDAATIIIGLLLVFWGSTIGAFYVLGEDSGFWKHMGKVIGVILVALGLVMFISPLASGYLPAGGTGGAAEKTFAAPPWITDFDAGMKQVEETGKPALIDMGAYWCIACHELDEFTFSDQRVIDELERFVVIKLELPDDNDPLFKRIRDHFKEMGTLIVGRPTVIMMNSNGEIADVVTQFIDADSMLAKIKAVK